MSYLRFEKTLMTNLEETLPREILRTNRSGAYHCTTIVDCNTRKYHGLLVVPLPELDDENHVLISSLDETVIQHGAEFNLGLHQYWGYNFSPKGHKYIREFNCDKVPTTIYRVGGVLLKKEKLFEHNENRILIRYTLLDCHSETTLRFQPFLAFRSVRQFTHENSNASREYREVENGIATSMYAGYPELFMQFSKENEFVFRPDWYRKFEYSKELERGYDFNEDLYVPGYFEMPMKKGESIVFSAGLSEVRTKGLKRTFTVEANERTPRDNFYHCLKNAAHQFHNKVGGHHYILAGYPWFKCRARDMFVSLPGLTLSIKEIQEFAKLLTSLLMALTLAVSSHAELQGSKDYEPGKIESTGWSALLGVGGGNSLIARDGTIFMNLRIGVVLNPYISLGGYFSTILSDVKNPKIRHPQMLDYHSYGIFAEPVVFRNGIFSISSRRRRHPISATPSDARTKSSCSSRQPSMKNV